MPTMTKERLFIPDKGASHALLITLFSEKNTGTGKGYVSHERLKKDMSEELNISDSPTETHLRMEIGKLRSALKIIGGDFEIETRRDFGYRIVEKKEQKRENSYASELERIPIPRKSAKHALFTAFNTKNNYENGYVSKNTLKKAIKKELEKNKLPSNTSLQSAIAR